jgi:glycyl-tRNA synthetase
MKKREDDITRIVFDNNELQLYQVAVFQLSNNSDILNILNKVIVPMLYKKGNKVYTDFSSTSIGKRYVRADQLGIKTCITIDFQTLVDNTVTIRDRNTGLQTRCLISDLIVNK